jgi:hypothetical protein
MLSTAADLAQLATAAPWLAVSALALVAVAWTYRQARRAVRAAEDRADLSAARQGKRLGQLEKALALLDLRRRQVEDVLLDEGVELPIWPPDGPDQRRAAPRRRRDYAPHSESDPWAQDGVPLPHDEPGTEHLPLRVPVPPLDPAVGERYRR